MVYPPAPTAAAVAGTLLLLAGGCRPSAASGPPQHYEDPSAMIAVFEADARDEWQQPDQVIAALPLPSRQAIVADIGAGSGYFTRRLALQVPEGRVFAVDVDGEFEDHILDNREAWGTPNIEPVLARYDDPKLPAGQVDLVFTANTYAFIRDRVAYFTKVRESLRPGGHLAVLEFRPESDPPSDIAPAREHRISAEQARRELGLAGFELVREETFLPYQWFLILRAKE